MRSIKNVPLLHQRSEPTEEENTIETNGDKNINFMLDSRASHLLVKETC